MVLLLIGLYLILSVIILYFTEKYGVLNKIGPVIIAYIIGIIIGHSGLIPNMSEYLSHLIRSNSEITDDYIASLYNSGKITYLDTIAYKIYKFQDLLLSVLILLALPFLLYSLKIKVWFRMSLKTIISMFFALFGVVGLIVIGYFIFGDQINEPGKVAGLLVGLYTGGTPNLASLKQSLDVNVETYLLTHTYDTAVGIIYLLFLITFGKNIFRSLLGKYPVTIDEKVIGSIQYSESAYKGIFNRHILKGIVLAFAVTTFIVLFSVGLGLLVSEGAMMFTVILSITTLSITASFIPKINTIEKTFEVGMFFIVFFSLVVASMADLRQLFHISSSLFLYISLVYFGALLFHAIFCKIFGVDADTMMVTSVALLCSPPFVPMVAGALKNKEVIVSGLTVGIMGYAMGNYLGVLLFKLL